MFDKKCINTTCTFCELNISNNIENGGFSRIAELLHNDLA